MSDISETPGEEAKPAKPKLMSEDQLALLFTDKHKDEFLFVSEWGRWLRWDGMRWAVERTLKTFNTALEVIRTLGPHATRNWKTVNNTVMIARTFPEHARVPEQFDQYPMLLNTPSGTVDLATGEKREHRQTDCLTKVTPVSVAEKPSEESAPLWRACLKTWTKGDEAVEKFLQRWIGYCLTGAVNEEVFVILYGPGKNGKSKFVEAIRAALGNDFVTGIAMETLIVTRGEQHPTDLASLRGMRLALAVETEQGRRFAESKIKHITGGDRIRARFMRQDYFDFVPTHKLMISGNHRPALGNVDEAMRRRVLMVDFNAEIPEEKRDRDLLDKLKGELPGILRWALEGCAEWKSVGLAPPDAVRASSDRYLEAQDAFTTWSEERCVRDVKATVLTSEAFADWKEWAEARGEYVGTSRGLSEKLEQLSNVHPWKPTSGRTKNLAGWRGIGLRAHDADEEVPF
jgi:putative DNA primase/helicase